MRASELINHLQHLITEYGDLDIIYEDEYGTHRDNVLDVFIENGASGNNFKLTNIEFNEYYNE